MQHKAWSSIEETALKVVEFDPNWGVSELLLQFEFTNGYEMMHKA